jgi:hypothetical protein
MKASSSSQTGNGVSVLVPDGRCLRGSIFSFEGWIGKPIAHQLPLQAALGRELIGDLLDTGIASLLTER